MLNGFFKYDYCDSSEYALCLEIGGDTGYEILNYKFWGYEENKTLMVSDFLKLCCYEFLQGFEAGLFFFIDEEETFNIYNDLIEIEVKDVYRVTIYEFMTDSVIYEEYY